MIVLCHFGIIYFLNSYISSRNMKVNELVLSQIQSTKNVVKGIYSKLGEVLLTLHYNTITNRTFLENIKYIQ